MITAVMIAYNNAAFVRAAVMSALAQDPAFDEVIVVDDCSTDETRNILDDLAQKHPRLRLILHDRNQGPGGARNTGLAEVRSDYFVFLDGDDLFFDDCSAKLHAVLGPDDIDLWIFGGMAFRESIGKTWRAGRVPAGTFETPAQKMPAMEGTTFPWNRLYRTAFVNDHQIRFPDGRYEDVPWCYECILRARKVRSIPGLIVHYRIHEQSMLRQQSDAHFDAFDQWTRVMDVVEACDGPRDFVAERRFKHLFEILLKDRIPEASRDLYLTRMMAECGPMKALRDAVNTGTGQRKLRRFRAMLLARDARAKAG